MESQPYLGFAFVAAHDGNTVSCQRMARESNNPLTESTCPTWLLVPASLAIDTRLGLTQCVDTLACSVACARRYMRDLGGLVNRYRLSNFCVVANHYSTALLRTVQGRYGRYFGPWEQAAGRRSSNRGVGISKGVCTVLVPSLYPLQNRYFQRGFVPLPSSYSTGPTAAAGNAAVSAAEMRRAELLGGWQDRPRAHKVPYS